MHFAEANNLRINICNVKLIMCIEYFVIMKYFNNIVKGTQD